MIAPQGIETKPRAREMPHSRPGIGVTRNAAPPTKTMAICIAISRSMTLDMTEIRIKERTNDGNNYEVYILQNTLEDVEL